MSLTVTPAALRSLTHTHNEHADTIRTVGGTAENIPNQASSFHSSQTFTALLAMADAARAHTDNLPARHSRFAESADHLRHATCATDDTAAAQFHQMETASWH